MALRGPLLFRMLRSYTTPPGWKDQIMEPGRVASRIPNVAGSSPKGVPKCRDQPHTPRLRYLRLDFPPAILLKCRKVFSGGMPVLRYNNPGF
jgi:hypothetical protein